VTRDKEQIIKEPIFAQSRNEKNKEKKKKERKKRGCTQKNRVIL